MISKVSVRGRLVEIDLVPAGVNSSATLVFRDGDTEVWAGAFVARVELLDHNLSVVFEQQREASDWKNPEVARRLASERLREALTMEVLSNLFDLLRANGFEAGRVAARKQMREALGLHLS